MAVSDMFPSCPVCNSPECRFLGELPSHEWFAGMRMSEPLPNSGLYRCKRCCLKYRYPILDVKRYDLLYDNALTMTWPGDEARLDWNLIIDYLHRHLPQGGTVLDFGCYTGGLLARLGSNFERNGIEVNQAAAVVATEKAHARIWLSLDDIPKDLHFDVVIAADVIEHMLNPENFILRLMSLLRRRGILIITTGDADNHLWNRFGANWWYCFYPEHVAFLSKSWLNYLAESRGVRIACCDTFQYCRLAPIDRVINTIFAYCYGLFPTMYLRFIRMLKAILNNRRPTSVPGNGISADHLFIVLAQQGS